MTRQPAPILPRPSRSHAVIVVLGLVAALWIALPRLEARFLERQLAQDAATLQLITEVLRGALSRTEALPALIAERPILRDILRHPDTAGLVPLANDQLRQTALNLDVSDIYVMDRTGHTIAASNYRLARSFVGENFGFRPYFTEALTNGIGRYHALGTTSGQRGYYFAAPVLEGDHILGVVAIKITLDGFEAAWRTGDRRIIVSDSNNVVFLSDRPDWLFRALVPLSDADRARITAARQYPLTTLAPLTQGLPAAVDGRIDMRLTAETGTGTGTGTEDYVMQQALVATAGWRVGVLTPRHAARPEALGAIALLSLAVLLAGLLGLGLLQRRARLLGQIARQLREAETLEARVAARTRDLDVANRQLLQEVDERRRTEDRLRQTQAELVQAGKLAALGQMSAALSHEFNQPLAAVKSYAENARTFLDRGRLEDVGNNITHISKMADRMAKISQHLRNFARRPQDQLRPIALQGVISDALALMQPRLVRSAAKVVIAPPDVEDLWVTAGQVRLQQVLVNLISNALDAMHDRTPPQMDLSVTHRDGMVCVALRDYGPGIDEAVRDQIFDPFVTTKAPGHGLGLGLSISYNIIHDFGGTLTATNHPMGGAIFTVTLRPAQNPTPPAPPKTHAQKEITP